VALISQLDPPGFATHVPELDQVPTTQSIGHLFGSLQSIVCDVLESGHDPLNSAGVNDRVCN
jgi:hypothetical protein